MPAAATAAPRVLACADGQIELDSVTPDSLAVCWLKVCVLQGCGCAARGLAGPTLSGGLQQLGARHVASCPQHVHRAVPLQRAIPSWQLNERRRGWVKCRGRVPVVRNPSLLQQLASSSRSGCLLLDEILEGWRTHDTLEARAASEGCDVVNTWVGTCVLGPHSGLPSCCNPT